MTEPFLRGGAVHTFDDKRTVGDAVLFRDGRVAAVGDTETVAAAAGDPRVIDVDGRTVLPGFKLAVLISIYPILINICSRGVFGLRPTVERVGVVGFTPAAKGEILELKKDSCRVQATLSTHSEGVVFGYWKPIFAGSVSRSKVISRTPLLRLHSVDWSLTYDGRSTRVTTGRGVTAA